MFVRSCSSFITAYINLKTDIESEMVAILENNVLVETAEVSVTDIEENDSNRKKRMVDPPQVKKRLTIIKFVSVCYVRLENFIDMEAIKISLMESIKSSEPFWSSDSSINVFIEIAPIKSSCIFSLI